MAWLQRWRNVFRQDRLDNDLECEFQHHLAETIDRLMENGMSGKDAAREARRLLGNYSLLKERTRDMDISAWLDSTRADFAYGMRQLRLSPGFAAVAILSLALGIGANSAIFQLVNAIRLKSLPVENPQELVNIEFGKGSARGGWWSSRRANFTYAQWDQIQSQQQSFSGVLAWSATRFNLTNGGEPRFAEGIYVSGSFFPVLGVAPLFGRTLNAADDAANCNAVAVISNAFWQREFAGDPSVLGRTVSIDGYSVPIVGVTKPSFFGVEVGSRFDLAVPLCADRLISENKKGRIPVAAAWWLSIMGRLKPGATVSSAAANLKALSPGIMRATLPPEYGAGFAKRYLANQLIVTDAGTGVSDLRRDYERPLWILMATAALVLLIACANLANLLLARAAAREREIAVRLAIGASRSRLVRQLLAESFLLAAAGTLAGAGLALVLSRTLIGFLNTTGNPIFVDIGLDWRVLTFMSVLAVLTCLLFGLMPALRATVLSPSASMRPGGRSITAGREGFTTRRALVATQVALSFVLLVGALLFVRSFHKLLTSDSGFQAEGVLAINIDIRKAEFPKERRPALYRDLKEQFSALPDVVSAAQVGATPVSGSSWDQMVGVDGARAADSGKQGFFNRVSPGYLRTMGTPLLAGRDFDERDTRTSPKVAIVTEIFARKVFGGTNPIGHTFSLDASAGQAEPSFQVIGLIANTKYNDLREDFKSVAYFPISQDPAPESSATFVIRISRSPAKVMEQVRTLVAGMGPSIGIEFRPLSAQLEESLLREKLMATLSGSFGLLAGLLSTLGLYGVIAYMVARRRGEMGLRMALGAKPAHVFGLVLREAILLLGIGLAAGVVLVMWLGKAASSLLYGLAPDDSASLVAAGVLLSFVALIASYLPARRAAAINPVEAIRND